MDGSPLSFPLMFLQAGLQLIAQGQWPLGLGLIAAAGASSFISGYADGKTKEAKENAKGEAYDGYGGRRVNANGACHHMR